jgi:hypothetical protein
MNTNGAEQKTHIRIYIYAYLIFDIGTQNIWWRNSLFSKCSCESWISENRKLKLDLCPSPIQISSQSRLSTLR